MSEYLYHITTERKWQDAQQQGEFMPMEFLADGFIHAAYYHQLKTVLDFLFQDAREVLVLEIDPKQLRCEIKNENTTGGTELFPHIYGTLPLNAVLRTFYLTRSDDGFELPDLADYHAGDAARNAALAYVECINTKDLQRLLDLFADDGQLIHPFGVFKGKEKLAEFYGGLVMKADTQLSISRLAADGRVCAIEVAGRSPQAPDKAQYAVDLFEVNEQGQVSELAIYYRNFDLK